MSCSRYRGQVFAAVEGTLSIEVTLALEAHARGCAGCAADLRRAEGLDAALAQMTPPPVERVDVERDVTAIRALIEGDASSSTRSATARTTWRWIAAAAVIVAGFAWWLVRERVVSTPDRTPPMVDVERPAGPEVASAASHSEHEPVVGALPSETVHEGIAAPAVTVEPSSDEPLEAEPFAAESFAAEPIAAEPIDFARLDDARARVRSALIDAASTLDPAVPTDPSHASKSTQTEAVDALLVRFDAQTTDLAREGWPIARLVERVITDDDPAASAAAMRWLGRRGDALSARKLALHLTDTAAKQTAALALIDMGAKGRDALIPALGDDELRDFVVNATAQTDPSAAARMIEKAARWAPRTLDVRTAMELIARSHLVDCEPWLEEIARERTARNDADTAALAAETLAKLGDAGALRSLLRLRDATRTPVDAVEAAVTTMLTDSEPAVTSVMRELVTAKRGRDVRALLDAMLSTPNPAIVPALIVGASSRELGTAERRFAILLAGEQGDETHVASLVALFRGLERRERDLKAAALVALHALGGRRAVLDALADVTPHTRERALAVLDRADASIRPETTLLQIAKELEPLLAPLQL